MRISLLIKQVFIALCFPLILNALLNYEQHSSKELKPSLFVDAGETCATLTATEIGGTVYEDWNYDGMMNQVDTIGVSAVQVLAYDCTNTIIGSTTTDVDGNYKFSGLISGESYRIEFVLPVSIAVWAKPTQSGVDNGTTIQFVQAGNCASLGIAAPSDYCQENPFIVVPCFVAGDPLSGAATYNTFDAFVGFDYDSDANSTAGLTDLAYAVDIGATWGVTYQRSSKTAFTSATLKRHFGFGTIDGTNATTGGIYALDIADHSSPNVLKWIDVNTIGINTGTNPRDGTAANSVAAVPNAPSYDAAAYTQVGKIGIGDIDIQDDSTLWLVNLNDRSLYGIQHVHPNSTPTAADVLGPFALPITGCGSGESDVRPWGLKVYKGKIYIGAICSGESTQTDANLHAYIFEFDPITSTMSSFFDFDMNYDRGTIDVGGSGDIGDWKAWQTTFPDICKRPEGLPPSSISCNGRRTNMQPILSDIEFDADGSMILGIMDRWGMQTQDDNYSPDATAMDTELYWLFIAPGDVLRVCNVGGTYVFEGGVGCTQSPANTNGGTADEYYHGDHGTKTNSTVLRETALGALLYLPGDEEVMATLWDPYVTYNSAGVTTLNNSTGAFNRRQLVYGPTAIGPVPPLPNDGTGAKGVGLGDIEAQCNAAPIEIGNYVWEDRNGNGLQDACEIPLDSVIINLYNAQGDLVAIDTTDSNGAYYFNESNITAYTLQGDTTLYTDSTYYIVVMGAIDSVFTSEVLTITEQEYQLTGADSLLIGHTDSDLIDSDGMIGNELSVVAFVDGLPFQTVVVGSAGTVDHSHDFGFIPVYYDFGDLPDAGNGTTGITDYETLEANDGPSHRIIEGLFLGDTVDIDGNGISSPLAVGDDMIDGYDDEDGIMILPSMDIHLGTTIRIPLSATNTTGDTAYLKAFIDWNGDGDFDELNETVTDFKDNKDGIFPAYLEVIIPANALANNLLGFRIRLSNANNLTPYGRVNSGEVEDYLIRVECATEICLPIEAVIKKE